jgi:hypothetical protein
MATRGEKCHSFVVIAIALANGFTSLLKSCIFRVVTLFCWGCDVLMLLLIFYTQGLPCAFCSSVDIYSSHEGLLYCKPHFRELFKPKAVVDEEVELRKLMCCR